MEAEINEFEDTNTQWNKNLVLWKGQQVNFEKMTAGANYQYYKWEISQ